MALGCPQVAASAPEGVGRTLNSTDPARLGTRDAFASFPGCVASGAFHVTFSFRVLRVPPSPAAGPAGSLPVPAAPPARRGRAVDGADGTSSSSPVPRPSPPFLTPFLPWAPPFPPSEGRCPAFRARSARVPPPPGRPLASALGGSPCHAVPCETFAIGLNSPALSVCFSSLSRGNCDPI